MGNAVTTIVGCKYHAGACKKIRELCPRHALELRRNPKNKYDPNAIEVHVVRMLGHIPRSDAKVLAPIIDEGRLLGASITVTPAVQVWWSEPEEEPKDRKVPQNVGRDDA